MTKEEREARYAGMRNLRMREKLVSGECLDVRVIGKIVADGVFLLDEFIESIDYADADMEEWIWSIGRHRDNGEIRASTTASFYQNTRYDCLWLR